MGGSLLRGDRDELRHGTVEEKTLWDGALAKFNSSVSRGDHASTEAEKHQECLGARRFNSGATRFYDRNMNQTYPNVRDAFVHPQSPIGEYAGHL